MAVLTQVGSGHVIALLADRFRAVVAGNAAADHAGVIENGSAPRCRQMTIAAFERRDDVTRRLAHGRDTIVANDAKAGDRQRYLRVINRLGGIPADDRVAGRAISTGGRVRRALALCDQAVVATDAAAEYFGVVKVNVGPE